MPRQVDEQAMEELEERVKEREDRVELFWNLCQRMATRKRPSLSEPIVQTGPLKKEPKTYIFTSKPEWADEADEHEYDPTFRGFSFHKRKRVEYNPHRVETTKTYINYRRDGDDRNTVFSASKGEWNKIQVSRYKDTGWDDELVDILDDIEGHDVRTVYERELAEIRDELDRIERVEELKSRGDRLGLEVDGN